MLARQAGRQARVRRGSEIAGQSSADKKRHVALRRAQAATAPGGVVYSNPSLSEKEKGGLSSGSLQR